MIKICGTGSALPARTVTNDDLSKIMDTSDEWISSRTGIRSRHLAVEETTTGMSVAAAKQAMEEAGMELDIRDLPKSFGSGETALRLRQEQQL